MIACADTLGLPRVSLLIIVVIYILARMLLTSIVGCVRAEIEEYIEQHDLHCSCCDNKEDIDTQAFGFYQEEWVDDEDEYEEPGV